MCHRRYVAVDGGGGAHLLGALAAISPTLQRTASPRHADLVVVFEPLMEKLVPAVVGTFEAVPRPRSAVVVGERRTSGVALEDVIPRIARVPHAAVDVVARAVLTAAAIAEPPPPPATETVTLQLPPKHEREIGTELAVLSLGPVQSLTAGPARFGLVCDGEHVVSATVEAGYAARDIGGEMTRTAWGRAAELAADLDPLAPVAGRLAFVSAFEELAGFTVPDVTRRAREAALAMERAANALWWLVRFAGVLAYESLVDRALTVAGELEEIVRETWPEGRGAWVVPGGGTGALRTGAATPLSALAARVRELCASLVRDRGMKARTGGIGTLTADRARHAGLTGPTLKASIDGSGDARARLLARLELASDNLERAATLLAGTHTTDATAPGWTARRGEGHATVNGPRGELVVTLIGDGGEQPRTVEWRRPSAALLGIVTDVVADHTVADAQVAIASLDISMAEADG